MYLKWGMSVAVIFILIMSQLQGFVDCGLCETEPLDDSFEDGLSEGYTLFGPTFSTKTYLLDMEGRIVHTWSSIHRQALGIYLLENGYLLRSCSPHLSLNFISGGYTGHVELLDWNSTVIWQFTHSSDIYRLHNDIEPLPNGNVLMISWEVKTYEEAVAAGCDPRLIQHGEVWSDYIIEVKPNGSSGGDIVWEWHVWDHLIQDFDPGKNNYGVVAEHPELIDINFKRDFKGLANYFSILGGRDFVHLNSLDYNETFDQILVGARNINEIWVIDHNTTSEEATSHVGGSYGRGGDLLYRWGNPQVYGAGDASDRRLFSQHDARWVEAGCPGEGHITLFNNGWMRPGLDYSSVLEIAPPMDEYGEYYLEDKESYGPDLLIWEYKHENPVLFYSKMMSSAQRLPNGNTLICSGWHKGIFIEVNMEKEIVWRYDNLRPFPYINSVFKIQRYPSDYPGIIKN